MEPCKYIAYIFGIAFALTLISPFVYAQGDEKSNRETLRGFTGIGLIIDDIAPEIEKNGLKRDQIQKDVEQKLIAAEINILTQEEMVKATGRPHLYVKLNIIKPKIEGYVFNIDVEFRQDATLKGNSYILHSVPTWSEASVGITSKLNDITNSIKDLIDTFLNAYLSVNPKQ